MVLWNLDSWILFSAETNVCTWFGYWREWQSVLCSVVCLSLTHHGECYHPVLWNCFQDGRGWLFGSGHVQMMQTPPSVLPFKLEIFQMWFAVVCSVEDLMDQLLRSLDLVPGTAKSLKWKGVTSQLTLAYPTFVAHHNNKARVKGYSEPQQELFLQSSLFFIKSLSSSYVLGSLTSVIGWSQFQMTLIPFSKVK